MRLRAGKRSISEMQALLALAPHEVIVFLATIVLWKNVVVSDGRIKLKHCFVLKIAAIC
jgi:hypothetical protein